MPKQACDAGDRCLRILKSVGSRAKNLNYLSKLSLPVTDACCLRGVDFPPASIVAPALWIVSRYFKDNPTMISVDSEFETVWGWRACEISETWRRHNEARKLEAGQSQKRITASGSTGQTIGRHLGELRIQGPTAATPSSSSSSIVPADDSDDSPHQPSSAIASRFHEDLDRRTLPSLKAVGLLDSFENRRTIIEPKSVLPPLSKAREW